MRAAGESTDKEAAEPMTVWVRRMLEWMGRSIGACLEWTRDFIEALQMRLEVMKTVSS